jgi:hypothetical protein
MLQVQVDVETTQAVQALQQEAQAVGAAMRRIVDACMDGQTPEDGDLSKANDWLRAVGA